MRLGEEGATLWCDCGVARSRQDGWTRDRETGVWVCPRCRRPSRANYLRVTRVRYWAEGVIERVSDEESEVVE